MKYFTAIVEKCQDTGLYVGYVPSITGAHSQARTLDELQINLKEVLELILEDKSVQKESEFIGIQQIGIEI